MHKFREFSIVNRAVGAVVLAVGISAGAFAQQGQRVGNPYTPAGADFSITALQGIDPSNTLGQANSGTQVNINFEFTPSVGVTYEQSDGKLVDTGIGLYQDKSVHMPGGGPVESTGLLVTYNSLVSAASANLTVEDFDLDNNATSFKPEKVEPSITLFGANNAVIGTADPSQIFSAMVQEPNTTGHGPSNTDIWDINLGTLLSDMHASSTGISKVLLAADNTNGEHPNSDPYELRAVGKAQPTPEPASLCILGFGILGLIGRRKAKAKI